MNAFPADRFPAALPCPAVALKLARAASAPSHRAELSALCHLSAIVRDHGSRPGVLRQLEAANLRHVAGQLDAAARILGRAS